MYYSTTYKSKIGLLTLGSDGDSLIGVWIEGQKHHGSTIFEHMTEAANLPIFHLMKEWLDRYFNGEQPTIKEIKLNFIGTEFQKMVWQVLCEIPYGKVITYGDIAKKIAKKKEKTRMSGQAVGGAVGHNHLSIIVPCHRVVGSNGSLTGYAGGIATKVTLLNLEGVDTTHFSIPTKGTAL